MYTKIKRPLSLVTYKLVVLLLVVCFCLCQTALAQQEKKNPKLNRELGLQMLAALKVAIKENYYDPHFHGIDLDERFRAAAERVKQMDENWQIYRVIAQVLLDFNDSHTLFFPPTRLTTVEYGFSLQMIGNTCYVMDVKKGSNAEVKRLKVGDIVVQVGKVPPTRESLWKIMYLLYDLNPQAKLTLTLRNPDGGSREIEVDARVVTFEESLKERKKLRSEKKLRRPYDCREVNPELIACKLYSFEIENGEIDKMMREIGSHKNLILDLRGNGGGYSQTLDYFVGYFFDHDVKIGTEVGRKKTGEEIAKSRRKKAFDGKLVVLIDSLTMSAAEVFARVMQLERRGNIVGDVSAGAVLTSVLHSLTTERTSSDHYVGFYANITTQDLIMSDGKRLEGVGVIPDAPAVPSGEALYKGNDPVLAFAALLFRVELTPEQAGAFNFTKSIQ